VASLISQPGLPPLQGSSAQALRPLELAQTLVASLVFPLGLVLVTVLVELDQLRVSLGRFDLVAYNIPFYCASAFTIIHHEQENTAHSGGAILCAYPLESNDPNQDSGSNCAENKEQSQSNR
jgi:hypothetical protein